MFVDNIQTIQPLSDGLTLKSIHTPDDLERWAQFQAHIHGESVAEMCRALLLHHPTTRPEQWWYIEEDSTQRIVSALCLIPWRWRCEEVELKAGELGIVGTLEEFRSRGLSRTLTRQHPAALEAGGYDLSHIQGIPYFYRQFGYEYAMPLEGGWHLELHQVGEAPDTGITLRPATEADIRVLSQHYHDAARGLSISACRGDEEWRYLLTHSLRTEMATDFWLVIDPAGVPTGYVGVQRFGFSEGLNIGEVSDLSSDAAVAVLSFAKGLAIERGKPFIRLVPPEHTSLQQIAAAWGAHNTGRYAWQIHIPSPARLMRTMGPVLERRLAASAFAGMTGPVHLNLYRRGVVLRFAAGKLAGVDEVPGSQSEQINVPPLLLAPLALGWRTAEELAGIYPDFIVRGAATPLVAALFPPLKSFLYSQY